MSKKQPEQKINDFVGLLPRGQMLLRQAGAEITTPVEVDGKPLKINIDGIAPVGLCVYVSCEDGPGRYFTIDNQAFLGCVVEYLKEHPEELSE